MPGLNRHAALGTTFTPLSIAVDRSRLRQFANATGADDPIYLDLEAARAAGHPDLPIPPTFYFSLELEAAEPFGYLRDLDVDMRQVLHGEQSFTYHSCAHAGELLCLQPQIVDLYSKRGGSLQFLVKRTTITRDGGEPVADAEAVVVIRSGAGGAQP